MYQLHHRQPCVYGTLANRTAVGTRVSQMCAGAPRPLVRQRAPLQLHAADPSRLPRWPIRLPGLLPGCLPCHNYQYYTGIIFGRITNWPTSETSRRDFSDGHFHRISDISVRCYCSIDPAYSCTGTVHYRTVHEYSTVPYNNKYMYVQSTRYPDS